MTASEEVSPAASLSPVIVSRRGSERTPVRRGRPNPTGALCPYGGPPVRRKRWTACAAVSRSPDLAAVRCPATRGDGGAVG